MISRGTLPGQPEAFSRIGMDGSTTWKRVEIMFDHAVTFLTLFPSEGSLTATLQIVTDGDHEHIIQRFVGVVILENDKIYFEPGRLVQPA